MASHVVVTDTSFRRQMVKVTPGMYMTDVLKEACQKFAIRPSDYSLKYKGKPVDLSRTYRQTGLVSGAKLELVVASRTPSAVSVALQLPEIYSSTVPQGRLMDKLSSDTKLWQILRHFEEKEGQNYNFTSRGWSSGKDGEIKICYDTPVVQVTGRDFVSFNDLQQTLAQLGINSGSALIKLSFKKTSTLLEEAKGKIDAYFQRKAERQKLREEEEATAKVKAEEEAAKAAEQPELDHKLNEAPETILPLEKPTQDNDIEMSEAPEDSELSSTPVSFAQPQAAETKLGSSPSKEEQTVGPGQRPITIFSPPSNSTPKAALQPFREDDFEPSIVHAKLHQDRLKQSSHNQRLLSYNEEERLAQEKATKLSSVKEVSVKVRFPDQSTVVSSFERHDTGASLHKFVRDMIIAEDQPFKLIYNGKGPQIVPNDDKKLIKDLGFEARMLVNMEWEEAVTANKRAVVLKEEYRAKAVEIPISEVQAAPTEPGGPKIGEVSPEQKDSPKKIKGVPKWLKLGKK